MTKKVLHIIFCLSTIALTACTGQVSSKQIEQGKIANSLTNKDSINGNTKSTNNILSEKDLTKIYCLAIFDYIKEVKNQNLISIDTLFFGKRNYGQEDDFPNIELPATINNVTIKLIAPELGMSLQKEKKSRVYINLVAWVEKEKAEFIFVTFSNGFEHKFDIHIDYSFDVTRKDYVLKKSLVENYSKK